MARVFITGSADGLGQLASERLVADGHEVILHARTPERAAQARARTPGATEVVIGDLASLDGAHSVARQANQLGPFDAVIHNVGVGYQEPLERTTEGVCRTFAINVLAPWVLTAEIAVPPRVVYLSSMLHRRGDPGLGDLGWEHREWDPYQAYCDSKLHDATLSAMVARHLPDVRSNAVEPGWVPTKMGGPGATGDLALGAVTQSWLAVSDDRRAEVSGRYFFHQEFAEVHPSVDDPGYQDELSAKCHELTGVAPPWATSG
jgi:NAD(P)-dependent dehydrogenase (short-subunit alcohol dehydrogenase family)